jgi:quercetin dioxygenase-like cupin family protein
VVREAELDFLVLSGEALLIVEGQERKLQWDFVHCPPETRHVFVGAGDGPDVRSAMRAIDGTASA